MFVCLFVALFALLAAWAGAGPVAMGIGVVSLVGAIIIGVRDFCSWYKTTAAEKAAQAQRSKAVYELNNTPTAICRRLREQFLEKTYARLPRRRPSEKDSISEGHSPCPICAIHPRMGLYQEDCCSYCSVEYNHLVETASYKLPEGITEYTIRLYTRQMTVLSDFERGLIDAATRDAELEEVAELERAEVAAENYYKEVEVRGKVQRQEYEKQQRNFTNAAARHLPRR